MKKDNNKLPQKQNTNLSDSPEDINEILKDLSEDKRAKVMDLFAYMEEYRSFNGPLPAPEDFQQYEQVLPGAADRILKMAEKQVAHRTDLEKIIVNKNFRQGFVGQIFGAVLALICISVSLFLGMNGHDLLAGMIATTTVIGIITVFVLNQKANSDAKAKSEDN